MTAADTRSKRPATDRRVERTREAIQAAFRDMVLTLGFDAITPTSLAQRANIGRSTFYEHFANVDEVLAFGIGRMLEPLVASAMRPQMIPETVAILEHFWENRRIAKPMLTGGGNTVVARLFAERFEIGLAGLRRDLGVTTPCVSPKLAAASLAAGSVAMLHGWLSGQASGTPAQITQAMHDASYAAACAFSTEALSVV
jgi:AcrR family transcriptional regulator